MNGLHIPRTPLVVDYWRLKNVPPRVLFFLTHLHADHTSGLSSAWPYPIHCTPITARLLKRKFKIKPDLIVELDVGESRLLHVEGLNERVSVSVTVLDANHCPGSAMFLFAGYFGRILYTGDFRYSPEMGELPELAQASLVDILYIDNTYCHPSCQFPSRAVATDTVVELIRKNKEGMTLIGLHTLGKEDLLIAIAKRLGVWVGVSPERYETLCLIEAANVFTTEADNCFVSVLPFHVVLNIAMKTALTKSSQNDELLAILPTCIFCGESAPAIPTYPSLKVIPYSDHSSFDELMEFVGVVKPRSVCPIVRSFSGNKNSIISLRCNMSVFDHLLDPTPMTEYEIPEVIKRLFSRCCHDNRPRPISTSILKKFFIPPPNGRAQQKQATGVSYLSPTKEMSGCGQSHDSHVIKHDEKEGRSDIVETKQIPTPKRVPLEPKPVLSPVIRVLSESRPSSSAHRSAVFYGTEPSSRRRDSRKHTRSANSDIRVNSDLCPNVREGEEEGKRKLPSSVIRPMWVTGIEKKWGVVMNDVADKPERGRGREIESEMTSVKINDEETNILPLVKKPRKDQRLLEDCVQQSSPSVVTRRWLHHKIDTFDLTNQNLVSFLTHTMSQAQEMSLTAPNTTPISPTLHPTQSPLNHLATIPRSCDNHVTKTPSPKSRHQGLSASEIPHNKCDKFLGIS